MEPYDSRSRRLDLLMEDKLPVTHVDTVLALGAKGVEHSVEVDYPSVVLSQAPPRKGKMGIKRIRNRITTSIEDVDWGWVGNSQGMMHEALTAGYRAYRDKVTDMVHKKSARPGSSRPARKWDQAFRRTALLQRRALHVEESSGETAYDASLCIAGWYHPALLPDTQQSKRWKHVAREKVIKPIKVFPLRAKRNRSPLPLGTVASPAALRATNAIDRELAELERETFATGWGLSWPSFPRRERVLDGAARKYLCHPSSQAFTEEDQDEECDIDIVGVSNVAGVPYVDPRFPPSPTKEWVKHIQSTTLPPVPPARCPLSKTSRTAQWVAGSLAVVANAPWLSTTLFHPVETIGAFVMRLCVDGWWRDVSVDGYLPAHTSDSPSDNVWALLAFKAFAKVFGSYDNLAEEDPETMPRSSAVGEALHMLTGFPSLPLNPALDTAPLQPAIMKGEYDVVPFDVLSTMTMAHGMVAALRARSAPVDEAAGIVSGGVYPVHRVDTFQHLNLVCLVDPYSTVRDKVVGDSSHVLRDLPLVRGCDEGYFWVALQDGLFGPGGAVSLALSRWREVRGRVSLDNEGLPENMFEIDVASDHVEVIAELHQGRDNPVPLLLTAVSQCHMTWAVTRTSGGACRAPVITLHVSLPRGKSYLIPRRVGSGAVSPLVLSVHVAKRGAVSLRSLIPAHTGVLKPLGFFTSRARKEGYVFPSGDPHNSFDPSFSPLSSILMQVDRVDVGCRPELTL